VIRISNYTKSYENLGTSFEQIASLGGRMSNLSLVFSFILFNLVSANFSFAKVIQNTEFTDIYLYNCSKKENINICYPERESNPSDIVSQAEELGLDIEWRNICEEMPNSDVRDVALCLSIMKGESDIAACDILFPEIDFMNQNCKVLAATSTSLSEKFDMDLIRCEVDYQAALRAHFSKEFPGLNIGFVKELNEIDFIHNASLKSMVGYQNDILLLPEHKNNAFCNEDAKFSVKDIERQIKTAKNVIRKFYSEEGIKEVIEILERPDINIPIISVKCPGLTGKVEAKKIGFHKRKVPQKRKVEKTKTSNKSNCADSEVIDLFNFHNSKLKEAKSIDYNNVGLNHSVLKRIPYTLSFMNFNYISQISQICSEIGEDVEITKNGVYVDGKKLPKMNMVLSDGKTDLSYNSKLARKFKEDINKVREAEGRELFPDGTYLVDLMSVQMMIDMIIEAKAQSEKVAGPGKQFSLCHLDQSYMEIDESSFLGFCTTDKPNYCVELKAGEYLDDDCQIQEAELVPGVLYQGGGVGSYNQANFDFPEPPFDNEIYEVEK